jgi:hypothetical protein
MFLRASVISLIISNPAIQALPLVGLISPDSILNVVVLPAPFTPNKPKTSPFPTEKEILSTAILILPLSRT